MVDPVARPAARIVCLDEAGRLLLMQWRDPAEGTVMWEPPGGGIQPGETPLAAARRELEEETGLSGEAVGSAVVEVPRHYRWNGVTYEHVEYFFAARVARPRLQFEGMEADERDILVGHRWWRLDELAQIDGEVRPPGLAAIVAALGGGS